MSESFLKKSHLNYRPDIDGLRALAVVLVIMFHAFPKLLRGGFIGVDIFFVISGYLITRIILNEQKQGSFSLLSFYSRRIKRIFPALIVVLLFGLVAGWFVLLAKEYQLLGKHIAAGSIYLSNFVLKSESGYFDTHADYKPFLHLWSLSIEEQFYLVFPLMLIIARRCAINPLIVIVGCLLASFSLNILRINNHPTEVFFYPYTRVWELLMGSFLAGSTLHLNDSAVQQGKQWLFFKANNSKASNWLSGFGLSIILIAWYGLDSQKIFFPSGWAILPTIGACCLIAAGEHAWINKKILSNKSVVFIGIISYPLYLWHWVLLSFICITEIETPSAVIKCAVLLISVLLAWATYYFIERKIRFQKNAWISIVLLLMLLTIGSLGYIVKQQSGWPHRYQDHADFFAENTENVAATQNVVQSKECQKNYPKADFCLIQNSNNSPTALLIGDSHAHHLYAGLVTKTTLTGGNLLNLAVGDCFPFLDNPDYPNKKCRPLMNQALSMAVSLPSVKTIILAGRALTDINAQTFIPRKTFTLFSTASALSDKENNPYALFQKGMRKTLNLLTETHKTVIFVLDIPDLEFEPKACIKRPWRLSGQATKVPCAVTRAQVDNRRKKYLEIVASVLQDFPDVKVWDTLPQLCDSNVCWALKDGKMLYSDANHLSKAGSVYLGEHFVLKP